jgi:hypothetical protein
MAASVVPITTGSEVLHIVGRPTRTGPTWVWAQQDLDLATIAVADAELATLLTDTAPPRFVLLYLGAERFVDVRGLRLILRTARRARSLGGDLAVVAPPHCLRWMVDRFDLGGEVHLVRDARQAARWARAGR